ncbi:MAG: hypothetical protein Q7W05_14230 [Deltaproteobacteria bacterium]|nr:hypothetical protein [Deltaproteobacteria bacterium]
MFIILQIPIVDLRPFLYDENWRLTTPYWPNPETGDFFRFGGPVLRRGKGGIKNWMAESKIAHVDNAIRIEEHNRPKSNVPQEFRIRCCFRRFFFDGFATGKFEIGFIANLLDSHRSKILYRNVIREVYMSRVSVRTSQKSRKSANLINAGDLFAELFWHASSPTIHQAQGMVPGDVLSGHPVMFIEIDPGEDSRFICPYPHETVYKSPPSEISLAHAWVDKDRVQSWWLRREVKRVEFDVRQLRLCLLRLHTIRAGFRTVLTQIHKENILPRPKTATSERLQAYIKKTLKDINLISKTQPSGGDILEYACLAEDLFIMEEKNELLEKLRIEIGIRPQHFRNVAKYLDDITSNNRPLLDIKEINMVKNEQHITGNNNAGTQAGGNIHQSITDSFNYATTATADHDLKILIIELSNALVSLRSHIDEHAGISLDHLSDGFAKEITAKEPDHDLLRTFGSKISNIAGTVAEYGPPVVAAVNTILKWFNL